MSVEASFPPPWDIEEANAACFIVKDNKGQALAQLRQLGDVGRNASRLVAR
jgi:hypothetical protein